MHGTGSDRLASLRPWGAVGFVYGPRSAALVVALVMVAPPAAALDSSAAADGLTKNPFHYFTRPVATTVSNTPHPAVVRVIVQEAAAQSNGSGSFVAARNNYGLVVTNWHVVRDAAGKIEIVFPDGFRSAATVLKTDQDWDLAALLIWRPRTPPLAIAPTAPQPGDSLSIAGYGSGDYRQVMGKCTQYVAPSDHHPYEIVELSAQARQGDSGGPILNEQNQLSGVLFGASHGSTSGTYCGRVRSFLTTVWPDLDAPASPPQREPPAGTFNIPHTPPEVPSRGQTNLVPVPPPTAESSVPPPIVALPVARQPLAEWPNQPPAVAQPPARAESSVRDDRELDTPAISHVVPPPLDADRTPGARWDEMLGNTRFEQAKSILAIIGVLVLWGHLARWISR